MSSWEKPSSRFIELPFMKRRETPAEPNKNELKVPGIGFLPNKIRNHFIAMVGEFLGTFMFLFFAFTATQVANTAAAGSAAAAEDSDGTLPQAPNMPVLLYIALAFGFSLTVNVWIFFRISGGLFNPAVTLALAMIGVISWVRAGLVFIAEMLGAMASAGIVAAMFPGPLSVSTTLNPTTSSARGLFIEMFLTFELIFTILMLAAEKHKGTFLAPIGIGLALFIAELAGVYFTGGSLNPARSFGPCVALAAFPTEHWIYWLGPVLGAITAVGFYRFVKMLEYETANPGADFDEKEAEVFQFDEDNTARGSEATRPNIAVNPTPSDLEQGNGSPRLSQQLSKPDSRNGAVTGGPPTTTGGTTLWREGQPTVTPVAGGGDLGGNYRTTERL